MATKREQAKTWRNALAVNTDAMLAGTMDMETFRAAQREAWDEIARRGLAEGVLSILRAEMYGEARA